MTARKGGSTHEVRPPLLAGTLEEAEAVALAPLASRLDAVIATATDELGGVLRCHKCGAEEPVLARYWKIGWPMHHGETMIWVTARQLAEETR